VIGNSSNDLARLSEVTELPIHGTVGAEFWNIQKR
jgi:hypothetical protein